MVLCLCGLVDADATESRLSQVVLQSFRIGGGIFVTPIGNDATGNQYLSVVRGGVFPFAPLPIGLDTVFGPAEGTANLYVVKVSPSGDKVLRVIAFRDSNALYDRLAGGFVEADGSVVLAGSTRSPDFPTTEGAYRSRSPEGGTFLLKVDSSGEKLVFSTFLDDSQETFAERLATSPDGSYLVGGLTRSQSFVTTSGAHARTAPPGLTVGFICEISKDGSTLLRSTLLPEAAVQLMTVSRGGDIHILGYTPQVADNLQRRLLILDADLSRLRLNVAVAGSLLQVDRDGNSYVLGQAGGDAFLTTYDIAGRIRRTQVVSDIGYKTHVAAFTVTEDGVVVLVGSSSSVGFRTRNTLQPCNMNLRHESVPFQWWVRSAFIVVLDRSGNVRTASFLGDGAPAGYGNDHNDLSYVEALGHGRLRIAGRTSSRTFGGAELITAGNTATFVATLDLDRLLVDTEDISTSCLAFAAPFGPVEAPVIPGMIMTLFGDNLGPEIGVASAWDVHLPAPFEVAGLRLTVGGLPAPILFVQKQQINFIVPRATTGPHTDVCVSWEGRESCLFTYVGDSDGALLPAVLNQDGTPNNGQHPAPVGSVVSFFGLGFGTVDPDSADGATASNRIASGRHSVEVGFREILDRFGNGPSYAGDVLYIGTAPGLLNGAAQINVRVPRLTTGRHPVLMRVRVPGGVPAFPLLLLPPPVYVKQ